MRHKSVLSGRLPVKSKNQSLVILSEAKNLLSLLFLGRLLRDSFLSCFFLRRLRRSFLVRCFRRSLLHFRCFLRQLRSLKRLPVERDLGNANGSEVLAMSAEFLVLLLTLVVEDEDL